VRLRLNRRGRWSRKPAGTCRTRLRPRPGRGAHRLGAANGRMAGACPIFSASENGGRDGEVGDPGCERRKSHAPRVVQRVDPLRGRQPAESAASRPASRVTAGPSDEQGTQLSAQCRKLGSSVQAQEGSWARPQSAWRIALAARREEGKIESSAARRNGRDDSQNGATSGQLRGWRGGRGLHLARSPKGGSQRSRPNGRGQREVSRARALGSAA
jgi:hypothetical protein